MNKKFITLCVSALLAGGMVTPAFAADNIAAQKILSAYGGTMITDKHVVEGQYYLVRIHTSSDSNTGWNLHLTKSRAWVESGDEVSQYTLWQVVPVKVNGQLTNQFELVNAAGLKLSVGKDNSVGVNKDYSVFEISGVGSSGNALKLCNSPMTNLLIGQGSNGTLEAVSSLSNGNIKFEILEPVVLDAAKLNDKFLSSFTIGAGYYKDNEWISYADDHDLQGNEVFEGHLKATTTIGTSGYQFKQTLSSGEVYLWNGDKIVVLTNNKWSKMNNSLTGVDGTGYKFQLMTPTELANQEVADAADPSKAVIRSYVFKIAEPNVVTEAPLEVAAKIWDPSSGTWAATTKTWEELYVSEVNGNYYLTTAAAYEDNALSTNDYVSNLKIESTKTADEILGAIKTLPYTLNLESEEVEKTVVDHVAQDGILVPEFSYMNGDPSYIGVKTNTSKTIVKATHGAGTTNTAKWDDGSGDFYNAENPLTNAIDGNYETAVENGTWKNEKDEFMALTFDFGDELKNIGTIRLFGPQDNEFKYTYRISVFGRKLKSDGTLNENFTRTLAIADYDLTPANGNYIDINITPGEFGAIQLRFYRIDDKMSAIDNYEINEVEFYGQSLTYHKQVVDSTEHNDVYDVSKVLDGEVGGTSYYESKTVPATIVIDLGDVVTMNVLVLSLPPELTWQARIQNIEISVSDSNVAYSANTKFEVVKESSDYLFDPKIGNSITFEFDGGVYLRFLKVKINSNTINGDSKYGAQLPEISAY